MKLENIKKPGETPSVWKLNNILLSNTWVKGKKDTREIRKYFELVTKKTYPDLRDATSIGCILKGKSIALNVYVSK